MSSTLSSLYFSLGFIPSTKYSLVPVIVGTFISGFFNWYRGDDLLLVLPVLGGALLRRFYVYYKFPYWVKPQDWTISIIILGIWTQLPLFFIPVDVTFLMVVFNYWYGGSILFLFLTSWAIIATSWIFLCVRSFK